MSDGDAARDVATADTEPPTSEIKRDLVLLAVPNSGSVAAEALTSLANASHELEVQHSIIGSSLLCLNFNKCWVDALNMHPRPKYFAMHHADIHAPNGWLDKLVHELETHDADLVSAVVAIKDGRGMTSMGLMDAREGTLRRLTLRELCREVLPEGEVEPTTLPAAHGDLRKRERVLPVTFGAAELAKLFGVEDAEQAGDRYALCVNTGLWVCRFGDWAEDIAFETGDRIVKLEDDQHPRGYSFRAHCFPEDWMFSSTAVSKGLKVMATSCMEVRHFGRSPFTCGGERAKPWGKETDEWLPL